MHLSVTGTSSTNDHAWTENNVRLPSSCCASNKPTMLKRQRQPSPPTSADPFVPIPVVVEPEDSDKQRHAKRRRTQPPVLDGALRGWAVVGDGDEEDDDEEVDGSNTSVSLIENTATMSAISEEYKSTNSMLRDLHALQQHRLSFTMPTLPTTSASHLVLKHHPAFTHADHHMEAQHPPKSSMYKTLGQGQPRIANEAEVVSEHYENINKCFHIPSYFLIY